MATYATLAEIRAEGLTESECPDARVNTLLESQSRYIDRITGIWFSPRTCTFYLDGRGRNTIQLNVPIISITSLDLVDETQASITSFVSGEYLVYNRHLSGMLNPDDRFNPRIELISGGNMRPLYRSFFGFAKGHQNVKVVGSFGFTDYDLGVTPAGITPDEIKQVCISLVIRNSAKKGDFGRSRALKEGHRVASETSDGTTYTMERRTLGAFTGDIDIDKVLQRYRMPVGIGSV
jgi:hypothetical protein